MRQIIIGIMKAMLPNAVFIGFTGTPLFKHDELTKRIFGGYISRYDFKRSEEDQSTVKLIYENRGEKLGLAHAAFAPRAGARVAALPAVLSARQDVAAGRRRSGLGLRLRRRWRRRCFEPRIHRCRSDDLDPARERRGREGQRERDGDEGTHREGAYLPG